MIFNQNLLRASIKETIHDEGGFAAISQKRGYGDRGCARLFSDGGGARSPAGACSARSARSRHGEAPLNTGGTQDTAVRAVCNPREKVRRRSGSETFASLALRGAEAAILLGIDQPGRGCATGRQFQA